MMYILHYIDDLYIAVIFGTALAFFYYELHERSKRISKAWREIIAFFFLIGGYCIGNYSPHGENVFEFYRIMGAIVPYWIIYNISALLIIIGVFFSNFIKHLLSSRICLFFGKVSFSLWIVHLPIICSLSAFCFQKLYIDGVNYFFDVVVVFGLTVIVVLFVSNMYYKYVETRFTKVADYMLKL